MYILYIEDVYIIIYYWWFVSSKYDIKYISYFYLGTYYVPKLKYFPKESIVFDSTSIHRSRVFLVDAVSIRYAVFLQIYFSLQ